MGMKRYFYPVFRAHHAACMAVDFGMRFTEGLKPDEDGDLFEIGAVGILKEASREAWNGGGKITRPYVYIHPESLHLLEPQVEDVVTFEYPYEGDKQISIITDGDDAVVFEQGLTLDFVKADSNEYRIIQRNGIAFHWPESEVA